MKRWTLLILFPMLLSGQSVYLPVTHPVYRYLDKMEAKQYLDGYRDDMKPLSRSVIARFLTQIDTTSRTMTDVESAEQYFFKEEFYQELTALGYENVIEERWHLYQYNSAAGNVNFDLIGGLSYRWLPGGTSVKIGSNGVQVYGNYGANVGAYFNFRDNIESGSGLVSPIAVPGTLAGTMTKSLTPEPAQVVSRNFFPRFVEYDPLEAQMNVDVFGMTLSIEKMHNQWGAGERGSVILSNKAPSYPQIKLRMPLGEHVDFVYLHGWLHSNDIDTLRSYAVHNFGVPTTRTIYRQKYIAAHMLEFSPWNGVDIAVGESEIYGGRSPEPIYLIPFMYFKAAEHWMYDTDNSQMFVNVDLNVFPDFNHFLSLYIDEFSTEDFYRADRQRNHIAFTVGQRWYDAFVRDSKILVEYTRLNPWVYSHKFPDATFQSHDVNLGHWLGQNGDLLFVQFAWQPLRSLSLALQFESIRKGGKDSAVVQYRLPTPSFLYGPMTKQQTIGIVGAYEVMRDMMIDFHLLQTRFTTAITAAHREFIENPGDYAVKPDIAGEWDIFLGFRYNFD